MFKALRKTQALLYIVKYNNSRIIAFLYKKNYLCYCITVLIRIFHPGDINISP